MLDKSKSPSSSTISSSKLTTQLNISKCNTTNANSLEGAGEFDADGQLKFWPPSAAVVDGLVLKLKAKHGDMEANWEKIILNFKKELDEEEQLKPPSSSGVDNNGSGGGGGGTERREKARAKFCVPLSRREMEKDFEDMGERRLPRKPKKRPKIIQNQLDTLFPGLWLTEIHADLYRVSETKKFIGSVSASSPSGDSFTMGGIYGAQGTTGQTRVSFLQSTMIGWLPWLIISQFWLL